MFHTPCWFLLWNWYEFVDSIWMSCWTFLSCQSSISQVHWNVSHFVCASCADGLIPDAVSTVFTLAVAWVASTLFVDSKLCLMWNKKPFENPTIGGLGWCSLLLPFGGYWRCKPVRGYWWWFKPFESFGRWFFDWCPAVVTFPAVKVDYFWARKMFNCQKTWENSGTYPKNLGKTWALHFHLNFSEATCLCYWKIFWTKVHWLLEFVNVKAFGCQSRAVQIGRKPGPFTVFRCCPKQMINNLSKATRMKMYVIRLFHIDKAAVGWRGLSTRRVSLPLFFVFTETERLRQPQLLERPTGVSCPVMWGDI